MNGMQGLTVDPSQVTEDYSSLSVSIMVVHHSPSSGRLSSADITVR